MSQKKRFKFKFKVETPRMKTTGDGYCFGCTLEEATAAAVAGVKNDLGDDAVVTSVTLDQRGTKS